MTVADVERPALLRPAAVAAALQISRSKVYRLIAEGHLPAVRITGSVRVPRVALEAYIAAATTWPGAPIA